MHLQYTQHTVRAAQLQYMHIARSKHSSADVRTNYEIVLKLKKNTHLRTLHCKILVIFW